MPIEVSSTAPRSVMAVNAEGTMNWGMHTWNNITLYSCNKRSNCACSSGCLGCTGVTSCLISLDEFVLFGGRAVEGAIKLRPDEVTFAEVEVPCPNNAGLGGA